MSEVKVFWKHCGKRRNCSFRAISPFPTVFYTNLENFLIKVQNCPLLALWVWKSLKFLIWERVIKASILGSTRPWIVLRKVKQNTRIVCHVEKTYFNPLSNDKILDWSNLESFADDKVSVTQKQKFFLGWVENVAGKRENAGYQHFLLFPQSFQKAVFVGSLKLGIVWKRVNLQIKLWLILDYYTIFLSS